jgi:hypothetical protein
LLKNLDFRWGHWLRYVKETIISGQIRVFAIIAAKIFSNEAGNFEFLRSIWYSIGKEAQLSRCIGISVLRYIMVYGNPDKINLMKLFASKG